MYESPVIATPATSATRPGAVITPTAAGSISTIGGTPNNKLNVAVSVGKPAAGGPQYVTLMNKGGQALQLTPGSPVSLTNSTVVKLLPQQATGKILKGKKHLFVAVINFALIVFQAFIEDEIISEKAKNEIVGFEPLTIRTIDYSHH